MTARRLPLLLLFAACTPVPTVTPDPVPPAETLRAADCQPAAIEYRRRLEAAPPGQKGEEDPARLAADFEAACRGRLAGRTRRAVIRCWRDALTPAAFLTCNDRF